MIFYILLISALWSSSVSAATLEEVSARMGAGQVNFQAAQPWHPTVEPILGGALAGIAAKIAVSLVGTSEQRLPGAGFRLADPRPPMISTNTILVGAAAVAGALCGWYKQQKYKTAFDKNEGRTIYGAAALNDVEGFKAWLDTTLFPSLFVARQDNAHRRPLHFAAAYGSVDVARICIEKMSPYELTERRRWLFEGGKPAVFSKTINAQDFNHKTPAEYAALNSQVEMLALLFKSGASIDEITKWMELNPEYKKIVEEAIKPHKAG